MKLENVINKSIDKLPYGCVLDKQGSHVWETTYNPETWISYKRCKFCFKRKD